MIREAPTKETPLSERARLLGERALRLHKEYTRVRTLQDKQDALRKKYAKQFKEAEKKMKPWEPWKIQAKEFMPPEDAQKYEKWEREIHERSKEIYALVEDALSLAVEQNPSQWEAHAQKKEADTKDSKDREYFFPLNDAYKMRLTWYFRTPDALPLDRPEHDMEQYVFEVSGQRKVRRGFMKMRSEKEAFPWFDFVIVADAERKFHPSGSWQMYYETPMQKRISHTLLKLGKSLREHFDSKHATS